MNIIKMERPMDEDDGDILNGPLLNGYIQNEFNCLERKRELHPYGGCGEKDGCKNCPYAAGHFGLLAVNQHQQFYIRAKAREMFYAAHSRPLRRWVCDVEDTRDSIAGVLEAIGSLFGLAFMGILISIPILVIIWMVRLCL